MTKASHERGAAEQQARRRNPHGADDGHEHADEDTRRAPDDREREQTAQCRQIAWIRTALGSAAASRPLRRVARVCGVACFQPVARTGRLACFEIEQRALSIEPARIAGQRSAAPTMRWQGTTTLSGLRPVAAPAARPPPGLRIDARVRCT